MLDQNVLVVQNNIGTMLILIDGNAGVYFRATQSEAGPRYNGRSRDACVLGLFCKLRYLRFFELLSELDLLPTSL